MCIQQTNFMKSIKLLEEKEKLNHLYWILKKEAAQIYQKKKVIQGKYLSVCRKISNAEKRMMEIIVEYEEK